MLLSGVQSLKRLLFFEALSGFLTRLMQLLAPQLLIRQGYLTQQITDRRRYDPIDLVCEYNDLICTFPGVFVHTVHRGHQTE